MVAYNFQPQFAEAVRNGTKLQTIRPHGKRKHAEAGDQLQLYTGMRTKACRLLRRAVCVETQTLMIMEEGVILTDLGEHWITGAALEALSLRDGFESWLEMRDWFKARYGLPFNGHLIRWSVPSPQTPLPQGGEGPHGRGVSSVPSTSDCAGASVPASAGNDAEQGEEHES